MTVVSPPYQLSLILLRGIMCFNFWVMARSTTPCCFQGLNVFSGLALIVISEALLISKPTRQGESPEQWEHITIVGLGARPHNSWYSDILTLTMLNTSIWTSMVNNLRYGYKGIFLPRLQCNWQKSLRCHRAEKTGTHFPDRKIAIILQVSMFLLFFKRCCIASARHATHRNLHVRRQCNSFLELYYHRK